LNDVSQLILYEDNHLIVAVKPPRMLTQGDITGDADLHSLLKEYIHVKYEKPGEAYLGLIHRIDRPVGGLLAFARTSKAAGRLSRQLREGSLSREYIAVCRGRAPATFQLNDWLQKDEQTNTVRVLPKYLKLQGKQASLSGQTISFTDEKSLVAIRLQTGRAHQIRAQMAHFGHPLLGDARYNKEGASGLIALWGMRLALSHPITGKAMVFVCAPGRMPGGWPRSAHFDPYQRDLDALERHWPDLAQ